MKPLAILLLAGALAVPAAAAPPEGFRLSTPLTARAVKVGGHPAVTVNCALTTALYRATAQNEELAESDGRTHRATKVIELPPRSCQPLERWLKGKKVDMELLSFALFVLAHETGHVALDTSDELAADCYATRKYTALARAFGVKRAITLRQLRDDAPLIPSLC